MTRRRRQLRLVVPAALLCIAILAILIANAREQVSLQRPATRAGRTHAPRASARLQRLSRAAPATDRHAPRAAPGCRRGPTRWGTSGAAWRPGRQRHLHGGHHRPRGRTGRERLEQLPEAQHDAQGASLEGEVYVSAVGNSAPTITSCAMNPAAVAYRSSGSLPQPASDVAVTQHRRHRLHRRRLQRRTRARHDPRVAARRRSRGSSAASPQGLRYAAVAATGSRVIVAGGSTETGRSRAILSFDPSTGRVAQIGQPARTPHARLRREPRRHGLRDRRPWLRAGLPDPAILAIDPASGRVQSRGRVRCRCPTRQSPMVGGRILLAGGQSTAGTQSAIIELASLPG